MKQVKTNPSIFLLFIYFSTKQMEKYGLDYYPYIIPKDKKIEPRSMIKLVKKKIINKLLDEYIMFIHYIHKVWNKSFDISYLYDRMKYLGLDESKEVPVYDQMILYAAVRKGKGREELRSNKLNFVAKKETGDQKLDYGEEGNK